jgi:hypothetical protein
VEIPTGPVFSGMATANRKGSVRILDDRARAPWTSRQNADDLLPEIYRDLSSPSASQGRSPPKNCTASVGTISGAHRSAVRRIAAAASTEMGSAAFRPPAPA